MLSGTGISLSLRKRGTSFYTHIPVAVTAGEKLDKKKNQNKQKKKPGGFGGPKVRQEP